MDDLARWLGAQLDEDERIARAATPGPWNVNDESYAEYVIAANGTEVIAGGRWGGEASVFESTEDAAHIVEHDPARVLRETDAKRKLLALWEEADRQAESDQRYAESYETSPDGFPAGRVDALEDALRLLATVYRDREGFREEWAP